MSYKQNVKSSVLFEPYIIMMSRDSFMNFYVCDCNQYFFFIQKQRHFAVYTSLRKLLFIKYMFNIVCVPKGLYSNK